MSTGFIKSLQKTVIVQKEKTRIEIDAKLQSDMQPSSIPNISGARYVIQNATITVGDLIYVFGGINNSGEAIQTARKFDTQTQTWSALKNVPAASGVYGMGAAFCDGIIYVGTSIYLYAYDPESNTYTQKATASGATVYMNGMFSFEGKVYVMYYHNTSLVYLRRYDPQTDTWTAMANMSNPRIGTTCCMMGDKAYVFGSSTPVKAGNSYNPKTNKWSALAAPPVAFSTAASWTENGVIYLLHSGNQLLEYNPDTNKWKTHPESPVFANNSPGAALIGDYLYIIAGINSSGNVIAVCHKLLREPAIITLSGDGSFQFNKDVMIDDTRYLADTLHKVDAGDQLKLKIINKDTIGFVEFDLVKGIDV